MPVGVYDVRVEEPPALKTASELQKSAYSDMRPTKCGRFARPCGFPSPAINSLRERDGCCEGMPCAVDHGIERQTGMSGNLSQRHVQRLMGTFERKNLVSCQVQIFITVVEYFGYGKQFDTELCTRLLTLVDDPPLSIVVRMDVRMGKFHHVCMAQARKGAENEDIPVDACSVVGELDVHHGLQFRSGQIATFRVFRLDIEPGERVGRNPAVLIRRVGHQLQFLDG